MIKKSLFSSIAGQKGCDQNESVGRCEKILTKRRTSQFSVSTLVLNRRVKTPSNKTLLLPQTQPNSSQRADSVASVLDPYTVEHYLARPSILQLYIIQETEGARECMKKEQGWAQKPLRSTMP